MVCELLGGLLLGLYNLLSLSEEVLHGPIEVTGAGAERPAPKVAQIEPNELSAQILNSCWGSTDLKTDPLGITRSIHTKRVLNRVRCAALFIVF